jgi:two-component system cell cycle response regulator
MSTPKILLVDDTKLFIELEKNFLKHSPVHVLTASSGEEALEIARREQPDLIFMDINMPGMGGLACCSTLKADVMLSSIPVIMVSSCGKEEDLEACTKAGCNDFLSKPIDRRLFLEKARSFLATINRRDIRVAYEAPVTFTLDGVSRSGFSVDLSNGGVYVTEVRPVEEKRAVTLAIKLPNATDRSINVQGIVAWANGQGKRRKVSLPPGFGVEFTKISEEDTMAIKAYVEGTRSKGCSF